MRAGGSAGSRAPRSRLALTLLVIAFASAFLAFSALGTWQVQRRAWKLDLIERVGQRLHAPAVALPAPDEWPGVDATRHEYLPVRLEGRWLPDKTLLTQAVTELGAGSWVMTPLQQADGTQVLVNRGFVPQGRTPQPAPTDANEPQVVLGLMRLSEPAGGFLRANDPASGRWHSRDVAAMSQALGLMRAAPFFVDAGIPATANTRSADAPPEPAALPEGGWPRAGMTVVRFHNSHLVYALTWFGLALMVAAAAVHVARYEIRQRNAHRDRSIRPE